MKKQAKVTEEPKRLTPTRNVVRRLYLLSGNECAEPSCKNVLIDANQTMIGEIAHIASVKPTAKRFDAKMTNEDRRAFSNLLLLCPNHHTQVDGENSPHTTRQLKKWKADHERRFEAAEQTLLKRFETRYPDAIDELSPTVPKTFKAFVATMGEYGLTDEEIEPNSLKVSTYAADLQKAPEEHRDLMLSILKGALARESFSFDRPSLLCDEVISSLNVSGSALKRIVPTLQKYGLAWFNEDFDNNPTVELKNPCDEVSWAAIADFADQRGIPLERFVIEIQFGDLD